MDLPATTIYELVLYLTWACLSAGGNTGPARQNRFFKTVTSELHSRSANGLSDDISVTGPPDIGRFRNLPSNPRPGRRQGGLFVPS